MRTIRPRITLPVPGELLHVLAGHVTVTVDGADYRSSADRRSHSRPTAGTRTAMPARIRRDCSWWSSCRLASRTPARRAAAATTPSRVTEPRHLAAPPSRVDHEVSGAKYPICRYQPHDRREAGSGNRRAQGRRPAAAPRRQALGSGAGRQQGPGRPGAPAGQGPAWQAPGGQGRKAGAAAQADFSSRSPGGPPAR